MLINNKTQAFDFLRFILAVCVVIGHTFVVLFQVKQTTIIIHNLAVDGFFVLSGFLLALSYAKTNKDMKPADLFLNQTKKRIKRLWPEFFFATIITGILLVICFKSEVFFPFLFNLIFIAQIDKVPAIVNGSWYVSVLFWVGCFYSALLFYKNKTAIYILIPLIVFLSFGYLYPIYGHLTLHGTNHFILNAYPVAFLKGFMSIGIGISTFFICQSLQTNPIQLKPKILPVLYIFAEISALLLLIYAFSQRETGKTDFLIYFGYPVLIGLLYCHKETFLKFFNLKIWQSLSPIAYMLYLTHVILLDITKKYIDYTTYPQSIVYIGFLLISIFFAFACYHLQKRFFSLIKKTLFVTSSTPIMHKD